MKEHGYTLVTNVTENKKVIDPPFPGNVRRNDHHAHLHTSLMREKQRKQYILLQFTTAATIIVIRK